MTNAKLLGAVLVPVLAGLGGCAEDVGYIDDEPAAEEEALASQGEALTVPVNESGNPNVGDGYLGTQDEFLENPVVCVKGKTKWKPTQGSATAGLELDIGESQVESDFSLSANAKASFGLFSGSAKASFMKENKTDSRSLTYVQRIRVELGDEIFDNSKPYTFGVDPGSPDFYPSCGDYVTWSVKRGGALYIMVKLDFATASDRQAFEASAQASYATVSAEANLAFAQKAFDGRLHVKVEVFQQGGDYSQFGTVFPSGANGAAAIDCGLSNFNACKQFVKSASNYASGKFTQGLTKSNAVDLSYNVQPWNIFAETDAEPEDISQNMKVMRDYLLEKVRKAANISNRIEAIKRANYFGGGSSYKKKVSDAETQNNKNIKVLKDFAHDCFEEYDMTAEYPETACITTYWTGLEYYGYKNVYISALDLPLVVTDTIEGRDIRELVQPKPGLMSWGNWGSWRAWQMCPEGSFVTGYAMEVESTGHEDDTGLNGVKIYCNNWEGTAGKTITVWDGAYGTWHSKSTCPNGVINGFNIKVEPNQGGDKDDSGANSLRGVCTSGEVVEAPGGASEGSWQVKNTMCSPGTAVCGMRVLYEAAKSDNDDTSVNNIEMACCTY